MLSDNVLPQMTVSSPIGSMRPTFEDSEGNATNAALVSVTQPHKDMNCNEKYWSDG